MSVKITIPNTSSDYLTFGSANTPDAAKIGGYEDSTGNGHLELYTTASGTSTEAIRIDSSQNLKMMKSGAKLLNSSGNPMLNQTGAILQIVQASTTTTMTTTSTTAADTNLTATITPSATTSKILVIVSQTWGLFAYTYYLGVGLNLVRNSTNLLTYGQPAGATSGGVGYLQLNGLGEIHLDGIANITYLDSPATTSAVTYKTQGFINGTGSTRTGYFQRDSTNSPSTITLIEIAG